MLQRGYSFLERRTPHRLRQLIPVSWRIRAGYQVKVVWAPDVAGYEQLRQPLQLPAGETEESIRAYLSRFRDPDDPEDSGRMIYLRESFGRFLYTLQLVPAGSGKLLEIGSHPYLMSLLLRRFTEYETSHTNFFGDRFPKRSTQLLLGPDGQEVSITFDNVNVETESLPYADGTFDVVMLCEVLEHFALDAHRALTEAKRVMKPEGHLVLTTPNVARLENVALILAGKNLYDRYSGGGIYARHNREYTVEEVRRLVTHVGFAVEQLFTSDVAKNRADQYFDTSRVAELLGPRSEQLGGYVFVRARSAGAPVSHKKPDWLYRDFPESELDHR